MPGTGCPGSPYPRHRLLSDGPSAPLPLLRSIARQGWAGLAAVSPTPASTTPDGPHEPVEGAGEALHHLHVPDPALPVVVHPPHLYPMTADGVMSFEGMLPTHGSPHAIARPPNKKPAPNKGAGSTAVPPFFVRTASPRGRHMAGHLCGGAPMPGAWSTWAVITVPFCRRLAGAGQALHLRHSRRPSRAFSRAFAGRTLA